MRTPEEVGEYISTHILTPAIDQKKAMATIAVRFDRAEIAKTLKSLQHDMGSKRAIELLLKPSNVIKIWRR